MERKRKGKNDDKRRKLTESLEWRKATSGACGEKRKMSGMEESSQWG